MPAAPPSTTFSINDRTFRVPARPVAVICIDGCGDEYLSTSLAHGRMPNVARMAKNGYRGMVRGALPSFTNVNNAAICTGLTPAETGIGGNFFLDQETGEEVMMNSAKFLRADTILAAAAKAGRKVAMVTAKEKLRDILSKDLDGIAFSSEKADQAALATHGIENVEQVVGQKTPEIYSAEASLFVLRAGVALIEQGLSDFCYLSLTDYMQHKYAPEAPESLDFYEAMDREIGRLLELGAVVGATADHGMNAKNLSSGGPNVIYLESLLTKQFGEGIRVICPITDPYVVHHGALGSAVTIHLPEELDLAEVAETIVRMEGITEVYDREMAALKLELPADRIGDLFVLSARDVVLGRTPEDHDLSQLGGQLRSHGGRYEEMVPMLLSEPLSGEYVSRAAGDPRNFDIFEFTCNGGDA
ncbi:MAG: phosphonoacetate hydrolase [Planctomycetota bacterium]|nr:MAG: phosphonoacetate hydrolase [Planctomycetota bacterium]REJ95892.1 MAG: phosphonoacetate hydrolase [Planctomycetota bacterium]REK25280.1 MAG: phosphonoacetate hydrolase [Planctomycetota bacterium]REK37990.1 MAG: phosphonoacetate hydrolase [Planctomycetota bacterium]